MRVGVKRITKALNGTLSRANRKRLCGQPYASKWTIDRASSATGFHAFAMTIEIQMQLGEETLLTPAKCRHLMGASCPTESSSFLLIRF